MFVYKLTDSYRVASGSKTTITWENIVIKKNYNYLYLCNITSLCLHKEADSLSFSHDNTSVIFPVLPPLKICLLMTPIIFTPPILFSNFISSQVLSRKQKVMQKISFNLCKKKQNNDSQIQFEQVIDIFFYELLFTYSVCDKLYVIMTMDFYAN